MKLIGQGAEAKLFLDKNKLIKERIKKSYRLSEIDERIRKSRTKRETKLLEKSAKFISIPEVYSSDGFKIEMELIKGKKLSESLDNFNNKKRGEICRLIGKQVALLHNGDIIHGDLTTSNMILENEKLYFIDFGLGLISNKIEDKAVDLHLLKQALESKHYKHFENSFKTVISSYKKYVKNPKEIISRFEKVEKRGRYKRKIATKKLL